MVEEDENEEETIRVRIPLCAIMGGRLSWRGLANDLLRQTIKKQEEMLFVRGESPGILVLL